MSEIHTNDSKIISETNNTFLHSKENKSQITIADDTWLPDKAKNNYHTQRLKQSKWAFWLSFWGAIAGFAVLIITTFIYIASDNPSAVGYISGIIIEATSALFFTLSNKANEKISEFFDKLTLDSNTTHAMHMTKEISNSDVRDQLLVKLSLHLAGINEDKICKQTIEICTNSQNESSNQAD